MSAVPTQLVTDSIRDLYSVCSADALEQALNADARLSDVSVDDTLAVREPRGVFDETALGQRVGQAGYACGGAQPSAEHLAHRDDSAPV